VNFILQLRSTRRGCAFHLNTFDRHLLKEWLVILGFVMAAMVGLLLAQICYNDLRTMLDAGARGSDMLKYVLVTLPQFCAIVLPLCVLVSLLYTLNRLHRANELTAMRTAGVGFLRLLLPVWVAGLAACALVWWLNATIVPWSVEESRQLQDATVFRQQAKTLTADRIGAIAGVAFDEPKAERLWFFNRFSQANQHGYGASVQQLDRERRPVSQILAAEAWQGGDGAWVFRNGRVTTFNPESGEALESMPFVTKKVGAYREDPSLMLLTDRRPVDLSLFELHQMMGYYEIQNRAKVVPYAVRYYSILAGALEPLIVIGLAIPFAVSGVRVNPVVGVSKSLSLFFAYYVLMAAGQSLAEKGWMDPQWAAWLPDAGMAAVAVWLFAKIR
jgi:lipopolysaccharide export system permease protein